MKDESELADGGLVLRVVCGVMAAAGFVVGFIGAIKYSLAQDWPEVLFRLGLLFSTWLFGYVAFTGRFPIRTNRDGGLERARNDDRE
jgi:hypothetical protein